MYYRCAAISALNYCDTIKILSQDESKTVFECSNVFKTFHLKIPNEGYKFNTDFITFDIRVKGVRVEFTAYADNVYSNFAKMNKPHAEIIDIAHNFYKSFEKVFDHKSN